MSDSPGTAVVVVNYGSSDLLATNLTALRSPLLAVFVVDSFSGPEERRSVTDLCAEQGWSAVLLDDNPGFGDGMNAGVRAALAGGIDVIIGLNPDAVADDRTLLELADTARASPCTLVSPRIVDELGRTWFAGSDLYLDDGTNAGATGRATRQGRPRRPWATGACFAISESLWTQLGGFDGQYFMYWEDIDLSHRLLDQGGHLTLRDDLVVAHSEGQTQGREPGSRRKSLLYYQFNVRNRLLYAAKHLNDTRLRRWLMSTPRVAYEVLLQGGRRQLLKPAPWLAAVRGMTQGVSQVRKVRGSDAAPREGEPMPPHRAREAPSRRGTHPRNDRTRIARRRRRNQGRHDVHSLANRR